MTRLLLFLSLLPLLSMASVKDTTGLDILRQMHQRYYQGPCRSYTFSQINILYRNDSVVGRTEWYEAIEFPDKFRITFGPEPEGNFVIFKRDSVFSYKAGQLAKRRADANTLLLLLGGMYYREIEGVLARVKQAGYHTDLYSQQRWNGTPVYVIGAKPGDLSKNQVWVDVSTLKVLRILEIKDQQLMDIRFEAHQPWCKGFTETRVSFRRNGQLEKVEEYYDIKKAASFPDK